MVPTECFVIICLIPLAELLFPSFNFGLIEFRPKTTDFQYRSFIVMTNVVLLNVVMPNVVLLNVVLLNVVLLNVVAHIPGPMF
jgi:hypothetical protein